MTPRGSGSQGGGHGRGGGTGGSGRSENPAERRSNLTLRELLDDLVTHAREIARRATQMTAAEMEYAQERLEWLADEVWRVASEKGAAPKG